MSQLDQLFQDVRQTDNPCYIISLIILELLKLINT